MFVLIGLLRNILIPMQKQLNRRKFLTQLSLTGASVLGFPAIVRGQNLNSKLQIAFVATGGKAREHTKSTHAMGLQCIAFADIDKRFWEEPLAKKGWEQAASYSDWREMFQKHQKEMDVVFVTTPDHTHYAPSMSAISMGIHCYTEKPLTWSVREAQLLTQAYEANKNVVTQMGNQGHAGAGWRRAYEYIHAGAIGDIKEFHSWTNRPIWPQGGKMSKNSAPAPKDIDWEAWIGPAPMRSFIPAAYHPFNWRGIVDFGSGALGDMACHLTDGIYAIMDPGYAETCEPIFMTGPVEDQFPSGMIVKSTYRAKAERPGFTTFWYEGKNKDGKPIMPDLPEELARDGRKLPDMGGTIIIGTKGKILVEGSYWDSSHIIPKSVNEAFGEPKQILERSPGHLEEFIMACKGEKPRDYSKSNFSYAGPMTANIQLGNLSARAGKKLTLNEKGDIISDPAINALAWREPRKGWDALATKIGK